MRNFQYLAVRAAHKSNMLFKMGAVIHNDKYVLGTGYNFGIPVNSQRRFRNENSIHAEMMALSRALHKHGELVVNGSKILVCRVSATRTKALEPCQHCKEMLDRYNVKITYMEEE